MVKFLLKDRITQIPEGYVLGTILIDEVQYYFLVHDGKHFHLPVDQIKYFIEREETNDSKRTIPERD